MSTWQEEKDEKLEKQRVAYNAALASGNTDKANQIGRKILKDMYLQEPADVIADHRAIVKAKSRRAR